MKHLLFAAIVGGTVACCGCQTMTPTAKTQSSTDPSVAQAERVREVPWSWGKRKPPASSTELPPEFAKKFEEARRRTGGNQTVQECIAAGYERERARPPNFPAAQKAYEEALTLDPANAEAHHRLAILADMRQEFNASQDHYDAALRQTPNDANILSDLGYSHFLRKNYPQSQMYLLKALDVDHQHTQALKNLGTLYASQGRYDDAALAFHHYRSEAEAQELLAKFFPNGNPAASGEIAAAGESRNARPMPPEGSGDRDLKNMPQDQVQQLMEQAKQKSIRERELKQLADLRGSLQPSVSDDSGENLAARPTDGGVSDVATTGPARQTPWGQDAGTPGNPGADNIPPWADAPAPEMTSSSPPSASPPSASGAFAEISRAAAAPAGGNEMPFWNGAGVQQPEIAQTSVEDWPTGANGNASAQTDAFPPNRNPAPATGPTNAGSWGNNAPPQAMAQNSAAVPTGPEAWPYRQTAANPPPNGGTSPSLTRQAYQLGMSVGPGTMFPVVSGYASNPTSTVTPWEASNSGRGYMEMKPTAGDVGPMSEPDAVQWQNAPTDIGPQSPTDGWDSPTAVPWPGNAAAGAAARASSSGQLPLIQPAGFPGANSPAAGSNTGRNAPTGNQNANYESGGGAADSSLTPDWFNAPTGNRTSQPRPAATAPRSGAVSQWPYAPR